MVHVDLPLGAERIGALLGRLVLAIGLLALADDIGALGIMLLEKVHGARFGRR